MKFFTDTQTPQPFVRLLRQLGWDVRTVYEEGTNDEKDDFRHLITARQQGRILITFDVLTGEECAKMAAELLLNGGKIIEISRGPSQPLMRALGRLLFHFPDWHPFLQQNDGIAKVSDIRHNCRILTPEEYSQTVSRSARHHFDEYIQRWDEKARRPPSRRQRKEPPPEQLDMFTDPCINN